MQRPELTAAVPAADARGTGEDFGRRGTVVRPHGEVGRRHVEGQVQTGEIECPVTQFDDPKARHGQKLTGEQVAGRNLLRAATASEFHGVHRTRQDAARIV